MKGYAKIKEGMILIILLNWITYVALGLSIVSIILTYLNIHITNAATVHAMLETHEVEKGIIERCPDNIFGQKIFGSSGTNLPDRYLNLFIINDGPGVAKELEWTIKKIEKEEGGKRPEDSNKLPYIGKGAKVNVKGYLEVQELSGEKDKFSYEVIITFHPILWGRKKQIYQKFDAFGKLLEFTLN